MKRYDWEFVYPCSVLLDAAKKKIVHHERRLDWWQSKKIDVVDKIKNEGLEIDESLAELISNSYQRNPQIQVRTDLARDLSECVNKIKEHRQQLQTYDGWIQILSTQGDEPKPLHHDDWLFFFGN